MRVSKSLYGKLEISESGSIIMGREIDGLSGERM